MKNKKIITSQWAMLLAATLLASGCGSKQNTAQEIVIGASLPLSGALASFGSFQQWGYQHAVDEVNAAGGIAIDGVKHQVKLVLRDDKSDPNAVSANIDSLISADNSNALLGSCTPPLVIAGAIAAERNRTPFVSGCAPLVSFRAAKQWNFAWDIFFNDPQLAEAPFTALKDLNIETNRKVVILHDNSADGTVVGGQLWPELAGKYGYQVIDNIEFPIDTTNFDASLQRAKNSGADVLLVDTITPLMVSIRKQMAALAYTPKVVVMEKGAEPAQFAEAVGKLADGVLVGGYWDPSFPYTGARELGEAFKTQTGRTVSQHIADSYTAAKVLLDAIAAAGTLDKDKVNAAIGKTDKTYPVGPVKFGDNHGAALDMVTTQWQGGEVKVVWPKERATAELLFPVP
ncbi:MAG: amino acid ABC transporter substrate-binding protein [Steroidobacteraceae bacterium]